MKACIVDDDSTSRVLIADFLDDNGWEVCRFVHPNKTSDSGISLGDELRSENTRLLVMDVRFGRDKEGLIQGLSTVKALAENGTIRSDCIVMFVSQFGRVKLEFADVEKILHAKGITFYWFDKPVDLVQLDEKLH